MSNAYPEAVRREARRQWLTGRYTDEQIAQMLGIRRADTIRDWRNQEGWRALAEDVNAVVKEQLDAAEAERRKQLGGTYDQFGRALEGVAARQLRDPALSPRDASAISRTLVNAQRIRERALRPAAQASEPDIAEQVKAWRAGRRRLEAIRAMTATAQATQPEVETEPAVQAEGTETRGA